MFLILQEEALGCAAGGDGATTDRENLCVEG
jgi:hypothetical protein